MLKAISRFSLCCGLFLIASVALASQQSLDGIVATVNDNVITQSELDHTLSMVKKQMMASNVALPSSTALHKQVLDQIINRKLQLLIAEQAGLKVTDTQVTQAIARIASGNNISTADLMRSVSQQGMTSSDYRKEIHDEILMQQLQQQEVGSKVSVTPDDVKHFMQTKAWATASNHAAPPETEYHVEDILLSLPEDASADTIKTTQDHATKIVANLRKGMNLEDAATGESAALQDSDLGWRKASEIPSAFSNVVAHLKANQVAAPVKTENGIHILRLVEVRTTTPTSTDAENNTAAPSEKEAQQLVYQQKFEVELQKWLAKLRGEAVINMNPEV